MQKRKLKKKVKITLIVLVMLGLFLIMASILYCYLVSPVDKDSKAIIEVEIKSGMSTRNIAEMLEERGLIRSSKFFLIYAKLNNCKSLKASVYDLKKSMNINTIFNTICAGNSYNKNNITLTFKEGKRITEYAKLISDNTNNNYDDVISLMKNREYIKTLINKYWFLTDDILNDNIYYPLEGYLHPETYSFNDKNVSAEEIITVMLDQEEKVLEKYKTLLTNNKHTIHEYITLASIIELEGTNTENRKMIAGIFENRLKINMSLGSDVTTYYAVQKQMTGDLTVAEFNSTNPYNTRNINMKGLPVGAICSVSESSIEASTNPTPSDYYYFVADKNKNIHYTKTMDEHNRKVKQLKEEGNWIW